MKYFFQIILLFLSFSAVAQKQLVVDENASARELNGSFSSIKVSGGVHLYLSQSDTEGLAVSAPDGKEKAEIRTVVENGELLISYGGTRFNYGNDLEVNVYVAYKNLQQLMVSGSSAVTVAGTMELPKMNIIVSGSSEIRGAVKIREMNVKLSGSSDIFLTGTAGIFNMKSSGSSDCKSYGLAVEVCNLDVSGTSDVYITVSKQLNVSVSGASNIHYKGGAELNEKKRSGSSSIDKEN